MTTWILSRPKEPDEAYPTQEAADAALRAHGAREGVVWALGDDGDEQPKTDLGCAITPKRRRWAK